MSLENIILIYFIIGIAYTFINGAIRKLDNDDWILTYVWVFGWPVCFICLIIEKTNKFFKR
jgi:hypothetical protein